MTASSIKNNDADVFGPQFANDGLTSAYDHNIFTSSREDYPWIQWELPRRIRITGVSIYIRYNWFLGIGEVRAGLDPINSTMRGNNITSNDVCGTLQDAKRTRYLYSVKCNSTILARYITVQMTQTSSTLVINELQYTTQPRALFGNFHDSFILFDSLMLTYIQKYHYNLSLALIKI